VRFVINTHYHGDHVGGNEDLGKAGSLIIAHDNIRERMTVEQVSNFFDRATPPYPESNVIHMGDIFFNRHYPFVDLDAGGSIQGIIAGAELALKLAVADTTIIAGHGPAVATVQELRDYRDYLAEARDKVSALAAQGATLEQAIAAQPTAKWDAELGAAWITPAQFVTFIYNSLKGIRQYTPAP
jgi:glyoxylase-like metal-dependent hydrolase (beta-lactamase superfamily II)